MMQSGNLILLEDHTFMKPRVFRIDNNLNDLLLWNEFTVRLRLRSVGDAVHDTDWCGFFCTWKPNHGTLSFDKMHIVDSNGQEHVNSSRTSFDIYFAKLGKASVNPLERILSTSTSLLIRTDSNQYTLIEI